MKEKNKANESILKLTSLVFAGVFGSLISSLGFTVLVIAPMLSFFDIWSRSTNEFWGFLLVLLVRYAGAYIVIYLIRKKLDNLTNILPLVSLGVFQVISWSIYIYIPSLFQ